ncbi:L1 [Rhinella marina papillomavirus 1]|nr:L1 [Rhinella marina papillomavirus 1]
MFCYRIQLKKEEKKNMAGIPSLGIQLVEGGIPPQKLLKTSDAYTTSTDFWFTVQSKIVTLQGNPFEEFKQDDKTVPFVSPLQFRVVKLNLPDPNSMSIQGMSQSLNSRRFFWQLKGFSIHRQQPRAHPYTSRVKWDSGTAVEDFNLVFDPPTRQFIIIGAKPALGTYFEWDNAKAGVLIKKVSEIEDGDLVDVGFGTLKVPDQYKSQFPNIMSKAQTKDIALLDMLEEETGDRLFTFLDREQSFAKTFEATKLQSGETKEEYECAWTIPSGGLVSSLNDIFNKSFWINKSGHENNCVAWDNSFFFTFCDTTRGQIYSLPNSDGTGALMRFVSEFQIEAVVRLVSVTLESQFLQYINRINKGLLSKWGFGFSDDSKMPQRSYILEPKMDTSEEEEEQEVIHQHKHLILEISGEVHENVEHTCCGRALMNHVLDCKPGFPPISPPKPRAEGSRRKPIKRKK